MQIRSMKYKLMACFAGAFSLVFGLAFMISANDDKEIVIYHTNDMHGNVKSVWEDGVLKKIGLDIIKNVKNSTPNSILVDAGDAIWGTEFAKHNKGMDVIKLMNLAGYDVMDLGNHEFDYGLDQLLNCAKFAKFPIISANTYKNGQLFLKDINGHNGHNVIIDVAGKKVGFFGITTEETNRITIPPNLEGITFEDEVEIASNEVEKLKKENVDVIVAIAHLGIDPSSKVTSRDIALKVPGIDVIIDGHSHTQIVEKENKTVISQTGIGSANLGKIVIKFINNKPDIKAFLMPSYDVGKTFKPDSNITREYDDIYCKISPSVERVIGKIENGLYGGTYNGVNISRLTETNMGDFICDAMMSRGRQIIKDKEFSKYPLVAFENGGAVRAKINPGYIKMDNIYNIFPIDNKLSLQIITPKVLYQVLERGVSKLTLPKSENEPFTSPFGGFPQLSGIRVEVDPSLEPYDCAKNVPGKRITNITVINEDGSMGKSLLRDDDQTKIAFLFNDYAVYEYPALKDVEIVEKDDYLYNIVSDYITNLTYENGGKFLYPDPEKRIVIKNKFLKNSLYDSEITLNDSTGTLNMVSVNVNVDDKNIGSLVSNENAKIVLKGLKSGHHIVKVKYGDISSEMYINNEIGLKNLNMEFMSKFNEDIETVTDLIGQIPYEITIVNEKLIKFARVSYDALNETQKSKILNYVKLVNAEKKISQIKGESASVNLVKEFNDNKTIMLVSVVIFISGAIIWVFIRKRQIRK